MVNQRTDTFNDITFTVRARRGADVWDEFTVKAKVSKDDRDNNVYRVDKFVEFVTQTVSIDGVLGFPWVTVNSSEQDVQAAYGVWCDMPPPLMIFWANLIWDANQPPLPEANVTPGED